MITISDEIVNQSGLDEQRFKIKLAVMMYETHLMNLPQAAAFVGITHYDMQHHIGLQGIKIRWEEDFVPKKSKRQAGQLKGFVTNMADDFNAPLEDFKDYM
jgi:predicted HTH domain antitoxin